ncbi:cation diffusion facilitator family transporter [Paenibacillus sp. FSL K6-1230]|uniref:cation diffusion facilitator family transporter n=1 Tax=Paenibacillus sp. FSL K6-1230 TaxID=2921603 RepID=UPI0030FB570E
MNSKRSLSAERVYWSSMIGNLALALLKGIVGYFSNSKALLGDALYAASDAASALSQRFSFREKQGMGVRSQSQEARGPAVSVVFAILLIMSALQLAVSSVMSMAGSEPTAPRLYVLVVAFAALVLKESLFQYEYRHIKKIDKQQAQKNVGEHRFSLYCSLTALLGMIGAMAGNALNFGWLLYMDAAAGLLISCFVLRKGYGLIVQSVYGPRVRELGAHELQQYMETIQRVHGIVTVESLKATAQAKTVSIHVMISVGPRITVQDAQEIADRAKLLLLSRFTQVTDVTIHFTPYHSSYPYKSNYELPESHTPSIIQ